MTIKTGLDILVHEQMGLLGGRRVGLVTHPAAILPDCTPALAALRGAGADVTAMFGLEHGFLGAAAGGATVGHGFDAASGLPVYSLYGPARQPAPEMLTGVDVLVFDVQDVGARFYTFISTLYYVLAAARAAGRAVIVLDRPNPINGLAVEGPSVRPGCESFVGIVPIPVRYGLTPGELARYMNQEHGLGAELQVAPMAGWRRAMWFDQTGLPWAPASPAMPHLSTATVYPGTCWLEATNISEGRGTALPFEVLGAPWIAGQDLAAALNERGLPGLRCRAAAFTPCSSKYAGEVCYGVQLHVLDREALRPVTAGLHILAALRALYPQQFTWDSERLERLTGDPQVGQDLAAGTAAATIAARWAGEEDDFRERRAAYLLYE